MSVNIIGKKFFLKMCPRCGKQFVEESEFNNHIKACGVAIFKSATRANTIQDIVNKPYVKKEMFNKSSVNKEEGFAALDDVMKPEEVKIEATVEVVEDNTKIETSEKEDIVLQENKTEDAEPELQAEVLADDKVEQKQEAKKKGRPAVNKKK